MDTNNQSSLSRVLWITERYPPLGGGMAVSCARHTRGLRARDIPLDVLAFTGEGPLDKTKIRERDNGIDILVSAQAPRPLAAQWAWRRALQRHSGPVGPYGLVVGFGANLPGFLAVTYAAWLGVPAVVLVRGNDLDRDWFDPRRAPWVREALSRADAIGAVSPEKVDRIRALFPDATARWTPNGVDIEAWQPLAPDRERRDEIRADLAQDGRRVVGIFGEMKFKKRVPLWLGALRDAGLLEKTGLLAVGDLDEESQGILADPTLAPRARLLPFRSAERLAGLYAACDYTVIPSLFDGMPNVLLEAMACGAVPIVSDAGAMGDVVRHGQTGFLFPAEDRAAASRATAEAMALDNEALQAMSKRAQNDVAERFTLNHEIDRLLELFAVAQKA